jgi:endonuclease-8
MPEGPEIKRAADQVADILEGQHCESVFFGLAPLTRFQRHLTQQRISRVAPRGKALLIWFANDYVIYSHNQLYGKWVVLAPGEDMTTNRQLRIRLVTQRGEARLYSASDIEVLRHDDVDAHPFIAKLGPDILDDKVTDSEFAQRFFDPRFQKKRLGTLLLEQGFIAGTGNYLRSEILFDQHLHPSQKLGDLTDQQKTALAAATRKITQRSYQTKGLCLTKDATRELQNISDDYEFYRFAVFGHDGRACIRCKTPIEKLDAGGRRLYYCPVCQPHKDSAKQAGVSKRK